MRPPDCRSFTVRALLAALLLLVAMPPAGAVTDTTPMQIDVGPTGELTYSARLKLPPGTSGMTPAIGISYGSQRGNGLFGMGVRVTGFSAITRCLKTIAQDGLIAPVLSNGTDKLCLDGNRLRLASGTYGANAAAYQTEIDTFARVAQNGAGIASGASWFEVKQKNGLIYEYGNSGDSRIEVRGSATVVRLWALTRIRDRDGNTITFTYTEDNANGAYRPNEILYTSNAGQGLAAAYKVVFVYAARQSADPLVRYENGYLSRETNRIARIDVLHNGTTVVRQFTPTYQGSFASTSRTRVDLIQECGKNSGMCGNLMDLVWLGGSNTLQVESSTGSALAAGNVVHSIDANGDGRLDLVYASGGNWWVNWGQPAPWQQMHGSVGGGNNTGIAATHANTSHSIDYNGDGIRDVLFSDGTNWRVLQGSGTGAFSLVTTGIPASGAANGQVRVADVNGDGLEDLVYPSGQVLRIRLNTTSGFSATDLSSGYTLAAGNVYDANAFGVPGVEEYRSVGSGQDTDFNGDGRTDLLVRTSAAGVVTWRTLVAGGTVAAPTLVADVTPSSSATERPLLLDMNGDGYTDIVSRNGGNWILRFARGLAGGSGANSVFDPTTASPAITASLADAIAMDYDSDGTQDVLVSTGGSWNVAYSTRESFAAPASIGFLSTPADTRVADLDGDGLEDLAYISGGTLRYRLHEGN